MEWVSSFPRLLLLEDSHWNETPWKSTHTFPNPFYISTQLHHTQAISWHFQPSFPHLWRMKPYFFKDYDSFSLLERDSWIPLAKKCLYYLIPIQNLQYNMPSCATGNRKVLEKQNSECNQSISLDETEWGNCLKTDLTCLNIRFYFFNNYVSLLYVYGCFACMCIGVAHRCLMHQSSKEGFTSLGILLWEGNLTWILWRRNKCSSLRSHPSITTRFNLLWVLKAFFPYKTSQEGRFHCRKYRTGLCRYETQALV